MRLLQVLNLTAGISCLVIGLNLIVYDSIKIVEPNPLVVAFEVILATATIALNVKVILDQIKEKGMRLWIKESF